MVLLILDRVTKWWALDTLRPPAGRMQEPWSGMLRLVYVENRGVAFGLFQNFSELFVVLASVVLVFVIWQARVWLQTHGVLARVCIALIVAGGLGNILDRLLYGYVVDFIHLIPLPIFQVFNFADAYISCGAVLLFIMLWREDARQRAARVSEASGG